MSFLGKKGEMSVCCCVQKTVQAQGEDDEEAILKRLVFFLPLSSLLKLFEEDRAVGKSPVKRL